MRKHFAIGDHGATVVDRVVLVLGKANEYGYAAGLVSYLLQCSVNGPPHVAVEQQVFGRVPADAEFRKDNQVGLPFVACTGRVLDDSGRVARDVTDDEVQLG